MSATLAAVMDHSLVSLDEVLNVPAILQPLDELAREIARQYWEKSELNGDPLQWKLFRGTHFESNAERWANGHGALFEGPGDTFVYVGPHALCVNTIAKWHVATRRPPLLSAAFAFAAALAKELKSEHVIICPDYDLMIEQVTSGQTTRGVVDWLISQKRTQVANLDSLLIHPDADCARSGEFFVGDCPRQAG